MTEKRIQISEERLQQVLALVRASPPCALCGITHVDEIEKMMRDDMAAGGIPEVASGINESAQ